MSKIESGKAILKKKAFDFAAFTRNLAAMFYGQAEKKQVRFQVLLGRSLAEAYVGDELKLNQILINLLGNAIKFTEPGGSVLLSVQEDKRSNKASELVFTVTDISCHTGSDMICQKYLVKAVQRRIRSKGAIRAVPGSVCPSPKSMPA